MPDLDPRIVDLYDADNPDGPDHDFYRSLATDRDARAILDLGCGTGILTVTLGAPGRRVVGVDPDAAMLAAARARDGAEHVTWVDGDSAAAPAGPFDLALMTGNVAQHIPDGAWATTLRDLRARLHPGATLAFESRNPEAREWEAWTAAGRRTRPSPHGAIEEWMDIEVVDERTVRFAAHHRFLDTGETVTAVQSLAFRSREDLERDLSAAGFAIESVAGGWAGEPVTPEARLLVFVARAV